jgi:uncharacterized protein HemY
MDFIMTMQRATEPGMDEPGKQRALYSGHDGTRPTPIADYINGARAALDAGDVKSASIYVSRAIQQNRSAGHDIGMPLEAKNQKDLHEASHWIDQALTDIMLEAQVTHSHYLDHAQNALWRAIEERET